MSIISTLLVLGVTVTLIVNAPGWEEFQAFLLDPETFASSLPKILRAFWVNVQIFLVAEFFVLIVGLLLAVMRSLPGPVFTPFRGFAIIYADVFRGLPGIIVIVVLGLGLPGLGIEGMPTSEFFWGTLALVLIYSAYVSEVYRAGIESVHPSQEAAARSLGLSRGPGPPLRRRPPGCPTRHPSPPERLHRAPEGHGPRGSHRARGGVQARRTSKATQPSTSRPTSSPRGSSCS